MTKNRIVLVGVEDPEGKWIEIVRKKTRKGVQDCTLTDEEAEVAKALEKKEYEL